MQARARNRRRPAPPTNTPRQAGTAAKFAGMAGPARLIEARPSPVLRWHDHVLGGVAREVFRRAANRFMATPRDRGVLRRVIRACDTCIAVIRMARGNRHEWRLC